MKQDDKAFFIEASFLAGVFSALTYISKKNNTGGYIIPKTILNKRE